jgi:glycosyltransferase involved in cell wall biosynthesis
MTKKLRIAAVEPYEALSHRLFLEGLQRHSRHEIEILSLPARAWKWRMRTSAIHFAEVLERTGPWDLFFVSDYLNLAELYALLPAPLRDIPAVVYFHENQLTYPLQKTERRDHHFALVHFYAMLAARRVLFNSEYHRHSFFQALGELLKYEPDVDLTRARRAAEAKAMVLPLGTDVPAGKPRESSGEPPVLLWNHRFEYDKDPGALLNACRELLRRGREFRVRLLGQRFRRVPVALAALRTLLGERLVQDEFVEDRAGYLRALGEAHIVVSTARHEFFGLGTLEALRTGLLPVLPHDLAYPELLPAELHGNYLYARPDGQGNGLNTALELALEVVLEDRDRPRREALIRHTDRFAWPELAGRYDAVFESND